MKNTYLDAASVLALTGAQGASAQGQADAVGAGAAAVIETSGFVNIDDILQRIGPPGSGGRRWPGRR